MNARGHYGRACHRWRRDYGSSEVTVGLKIYHTVEDRAEAVRQMALDWTALYQNLASEAGEIFVDPRSPSGYSVAPPAGWDPNSRDPKKLAWWKAYAVPRFDDWKTFKQEQLGLDKTVAPGYQAWSARFWTNWEVYEDWKQKLDALRAEAQRQGFRITVPTAPSLPTTVWSDVASTVERGADAVATGVGDVWSIVKYGVWGALGIGAIIALSSVMQNLRSGKDPADKYMGLIRGSAPRSAPSAPGLPAFSRRPMLALPPGDPEIP